MVSEPPLGGLYWLKDSEKEMVEKFEKENNALVYLIVRTYTTIGKMDSIFYISDYEEDWILDNADISDGYAMTYTINYDTPDFSEFGMIGFKSIGGGVIRTA